MVVGHVVVLLDLLGLEARLGVAGDLHEAATGPVAGGDEDVILGDDRRRDDGRSALPLVGPQHLAVLGVHTGQRVRGQLDQLVDAADVRRNDGRVGGLIGPVLGAPGRLAGLFVEGGHRAFLAAGGANDQSAVHQWRFAVAPAGHHLAAEIALESLFPDLLAAVRLDADKVAAAADAENQIAVHRRAAARAVAAVQSDPRPDGRGPLLGLRIHIQSIDIVVLFVGAHAVERGPDDRGGGIADAGVPEGPQELRAVLGPGLEQPGFFRHVVPVGAAPLRPVGGGGEPGQGQAQQRQHQLLHASTSA